MGAASGVHCCGAVSGARGARSPSSLRPRLPLCVWPRSLPRHRYLSLPMPHKLQGRLKPAREGASPGAQVQCHCGLGAKACRGWAMAGPRWEGEVHRVQPEGDRLRVILVPAWEGVGWPIRAGPLSL